MFVGAEAHSGQADSASVGAAGPSLIALALSFFF